MTRPRFLFAFTTLSGALLTAAPALACSPLLYTDPATGRAYGAESPEGLARRQADWRAGSEVVVLARIEAGRLSDLYQVDYTLTPIIPVYDGELPDRDLSIRWMPGHSCNRFNLGIGDTVVAFVGADGAVVGFTVPGQLQDRPPEFDRRLREIRRGLIGPKQ